MKALLICPAARPAVKVLSEQAPLASLPILGKSLTEYWLAHLASLGAKQVRVLVTDRPAQVRAQVGDGARWGLQVEVRSAAWELTPDEARSKYQEPSTPEPIDLVLMDHLPGLPQQALFKSYASWFAALQAWMPRASTPDRIGLREIRPGVWVGLHARVSPRAELRAPCWLGENVYVGPKAVIGPRAILEDRVFIEKAAEIAYSIIGPKTFVGEGTDVEHSLAWGSTLLNWKTGSCLKVPDAFLLCSLATGVEAPAETSTGARRSFSVLEAAFSEQRI